jgi:hypothetical protein
MTCSWCGYSFVNQDDDEASQDTSISTVQCSRCDAEYCNKHCKTQHFTTGCHKYSCCRQLFERTPDGTGQCQKAGPLYVQGRSWHEIFTTSLDLKGTSIRKQCVEMYLAQIILAYGRCECAGIHHAIKEEQNISFSWPRVGAKHITFVGCCPLTMLEAFTHFGNHYLDLLQVSGIELDDRTCVSTYQHVGNYWWNRVELLYLLQEVGHMGVSLGYCADLALWQDDFNTSRRILCDMAKIGERHGILVLEFFSLRGHGRACLKEGNLQEALRLFVQSYDTLPFVESGYDAEILCTLQNILQVKLLIVKDFKVKGAEQDRLWAEVQVAYNVFHQRIVFEVGEHQIEPENATRMTIFDFSVHAILTERSGGKKKSRAAFLDVIRTAKTILDMEDHTIFRDVNMEMKLAITGFKRNASEKVYTALLFWINVAVYEHDSE